MPVYLRNFYTKKLEETIKKEAEANNTVQNNTTPNIRPRLKT